MTAHTTVAAAASSVSVMIALPLITTKWTVDSDSSSQRVIAALDQDHQAPQQREPRGTARGPPGRAASAASIG